MGQNHIRSYSGVESTRVAAICDVDMGTQGIHEMDIARWGLGVTLPVKISAVGGHFMFDDDQQTPNDLIAVFEFTNPYIVDNEV